MPLKTVALCLIAAFLGQELAHANLDPRPADGAAFRTVFLVQDAHTNPSAQLDIAKKLEALIEKEKLSTVYLEGGFGDVSLNALKEQAPAAAREAVGLKYVKRGELSGAEYQNLLSEKDFTLWGVEDEILYWKSIEAYRQVAKDRPDWKEYLGKVRATVDVLKPRVFNAGLAELDSKRESSLNDDADLAAYLRWLSETARASGIDAGNFFQIRSLLALKEKEAAIDFEKANAKDAAELAKYEEYSKQAASLKAPELLEEKALLEAKVYEALIETPDEKRLHEVSEALKKLEALLSLQATSREASMDMVALTAFLNRKIMELGSHYERALFLNDEFNATLKKAEEFYRLTEDRDRVFVDRLLARMAEKGEKRAALVTGGYHTPHLKQLLKEKRIEFKVISPEVANETSSARYERLLLSQASAENGIPDKVSLLALQNRRHGAAITPTTFKTELDAAGSRLSTVVGGAPKDPARKVIYQALVNYEPKPSGVSAIVSAASEFLDIKEAPFAPVVRTYSSAARDIRSMDELGLMDKVLDGDGKVTVRVNVDSFSKWITELRKDLSPVNAFLGELLPAVVREATGYAHLSANGELSDFMKERRSLYRSMRWRFLTMPVLSFFSRNFAQWFVLEDQQENILRLTAQSAAGEFVETKAQRDASRWVFETFLADRGRVPSAAMEDYLNIDDAGLLAHEIAGTLAMIAFNQFAASRTEGAAYGAFFALQIYRWKNSDGREGLSPEAFNSLMQKKRVSQEDLRSTTAQLLPYALEYESRGKTLVEQWMRQHSGARLASAEFPDTEQAIRLMGSIIERTPEEYHGYGIRIDEDFAASSDLLRQLDRLDRPVENVVVVGSGLRTWAPLLVLTGRKVAFVDILKQELQSSLSMTSHVLNAAASEGYDVQFDLRLFEKEFGRLDLDGVSLERGGYDLVSFIDLVGGAPQGGPRRWLRKAKALLKDGGHLLIDEENTGTHSILNNFFKVFPHHRLISPQYHQGVFNLETSVNSRYTTLARTNRLYQVFRSGREGLTDSRQAPTPETGRHLLASMVALKRLQHHLDLSSYRFVYDIQAIFEEHRPRPFDDVHGHDPVTAAKQLVFYTALIVQAHIERLQEAAPDRFAVDLLRIEAEFSHLRHLIDVLAWAPTPLMPYHLTTQDAGIFGQYVDTARDSFLAALATVIHRPTVEVGSRYAGHTAASNEDGGTDGPEGELYHETWLGSIVMAVRGSDAAFSPGTWFADAPERAIAHGEVADADDQRSTPKIRLVFDADVLKAMGVDFVRADGRTGSHWRSTGPVPLAALTPGSHGELSEALDHLAQASPRWALSEQESMRISGARLSLVGLPRAAALEKLRARGYDDKTALALVGAIQKKLGSAQEPMNLEQLGRIFEKSYAQFWPMNLPGLLAWAEYRQIKVLEGLGVVSDVTMDPVVLVPNASDVEVFATAVKIVNVVEREISLERSKEKVAARLEAERAPSSGARMAEQKRVAALSSAGSIDETVEALNPRSSLLRERIVTPLQTYDFVHDRLGLYVRVGGLPVLSHQLEFQDEGPFPRPVFVNDRVQWDLFLAPILASMQDVDLRGRVVEDIGAGNGILSAAALRLGAKRVVAIELDESEALEAEETLRDAGFRGKRLPLNGISPSFIAPSDEFVILVGDANRWFSFSERQRQAITGTSTTVKVANIGYYYSVHEDLLRYILTTPTDLAIVGGYPEDKPGTKDVHEQKGYREAVWQFQVSNWKTAVAEYASSQGGFYSLAAAPSGARLAVAYHKQVRDLLVQFDKSLSEGTGFGPSMPAMLPLFSYPHVRDLAQMHLSMSQSHDENAHETYLRLFALLFLDRGFQKSDWARFEAAVESYNRTFGRSLLIEDIFLESISPAIFSNAEYVRLSENLLTLPSEYRPAVVASALVRQALHLAEFEGDTEDYAASSKLIKYALNYVRTGPFSVPRPHRQPSLTNPVRVEDMEMAVARLLVETPAYLRRYSQGQFAGKERGITEKQARSFGAAVLSERNRPFIREILRRVRERELERKDVSIFRLSWKFAYLFLMSNPELSRLSLTDFLLHTDRDTAFSKAVLEKKDPGRREWAWDPEEVIDRKFRGVESFFPEEQGARLGAVAKGALTLGLMFFFPSVAHASTYAVQKGDTLWKIAKELLGDPTRWREIHKLNQAGVGDIVHKNGLEIVNIRPDQVLQIPDGATERAADVITTSIPDMTAKAGDAALRFSETVTVTAPSSSDAALAVDKVETSTLDFPTFDMHSFDVDALINPISASLGTVADATGHLGSAAVEGLGNATHVLMATVVQTPMPTEPYQWALMAFTFVVSGGASYLARHPEIVRGALKRLRTSVRTNAPPKDVLQRFRSFKARRTKSALVVPKAPTVSSATPQPITAFTPPSQPVSMPAPVRIDAPAAVAMPSTSSTSRIFWLRDVTERSAPAMSSPGTVIPRGADAAPIETVVRTIEAAVPAEVQIIAVPEDPSEAPSPEFEVLPVAAREVLLEAAQELEDARIVVVTTPPAQERPADLRQTLLLAAADIPGPAEVEIVTFDHHDQGPGSSGSAQLLLVEVRRTVPDAEILIVRASAADPEIPVEETAAPAPLTGLGILSPGILVLAPSPSETLTPEFPIVPDRPLPPVVTEKQFLDMAALIQGLLPWDTTAVLLDQEAPMDDLHPDVPAVYRQMVDEAALEAPKPSNGAVTLVVRPPATSVNEPRRLTETLTKVRGFLPEGSTILVTPPSSSPREEAPMTVETATRPTPSAHSMSFFASSSGTTHTSFVQETFAPNAAAPVEDIVRSIEAVVPEEVEVVAVPAASEAGAPSSQFKALPASAQTFLLEAGQKVDARLVVITAAPDEQDILNDLRDRVITAAGEAATAGSQVEVFTPGAEDHDVSLPETVQELLLQARLAMPGSEILIVTPTADPAPSPIFALDVPPSASVVLPATPSVPQRWLPAPASRALLTEGVPMSALTVVPPATQTLKVTVHPVNTAPRTVWREVDGPMSPLTSTVQAVTLTPVSDITTSPTTLFEVRDVSDVDGGPAERMEMDEIEAPSRPPVPGARAFQMTWTARPSTTQTVWVSELPGSQRTSTSAPFTRTFVVKEVVEDAAQVREAVEPVPARTEAAAPAPRKRLAPIVLDPPKLEGMGEEKEKKRSLAAKFASYLQERSAQREKQRLVDAGFSDEAAAKLMQESPKKRELALLYRKLGDTGTRAVKTVQPIAPKKDAAEARVKKAQETAAAAVPEIQRYSDASSEVQQAIQEALFHITVTNSPKEQQKAIEEMTSSDPALRDQMRQGVEVLVSRVGTLKYRILLGYLGGAVRSDGHLSEEPAHIIRARLRKDDGRPQGVPEVFQETKRYPSREPAGHVSTREEDLQAKLMSLRITRAKKTSASADASSTTEPSKKRAVIGERLPQVDVPDGVRTRSPHRGETAPVPEASRREREKAIVRGETVTDLDPKPEVSARSVVRGETIPPIEIPDGIRTRPVVRGETLPPSEASRRERERAVERGETVTDLDPKREGRTRPVVIGETFQEPVPGSATSLVGALGTDEEVVVPSTSPDASILAGRYSGYDTAGLNRDVPVPNSQLPMAGHFDAYADSTAWPERQAKVHPVDPPPAIAPGRVAAVERSAKSGALAYFYRTFERLPVDAAEAATRKDILQFAQYSLVPGDYPKARQLVFDLHPDESLWKELFFLVSRTRSVQPRQGSFFWGFRHALRSKHPLRSAFAAGLTAYQRLKGMEFADEIARGVVQAMTDPDIVKNKASQKLSELPLSDEQWVDIRRKLRGIDPKVDEMLSKAHSPWKYRRSRLLTPATERALRSARPFIDRSVDIFRLADGWLWYLMIELPRSITQEPEVGGKFVSIQEISRNARQQEDLHVRPGKVLGLTDFAKRSEGLPAEGSRLALRAPVEERVRVPLLTDRLMVIAQDVDVLAQELDARDVHERIPLREEHRAEIRRIYRGLIDARFWARHLPLEMKDRLRSVRLSIRRLENYESDSLNRLAKRVLIAARADLGAILDGLPPDALPEALAAERSLRPRARRFFGEIDDSLPSRRSFFSTVRERSRRKLMDASEEMIVFLQEFGPTGEFRYFSFVHTGLLPLITALKAAIGRVPAATTLGKEIDLKKAEAIIRRLKENYEAAIAEIKALSDPSSEVLTMYHRMKESGRKYALSDIELTGRPSTEAEVLLRLKDLEARGYPLRRDNEGWQVAGVAAQEQFTFDLGDWHSDNGAEWRALEGDDSGEAIGRRLRILHDEFKLQHGWNWDRFGRALRRNPRTFRHLVDSWSSGRQAPVEDLLNEVAEALGVETTWLRYGQSRSRSEGSLLPFFPGMTQGDRLSTLRRLSGWSMERLVRTLQEDGIETSSGSLYDLESGRRPLLRNPMILTRAAALMGYPPSLLHFGVEDADAYLLSLPIDERMTAAHQLRGFSENAFAEALGLSHSAVQGWRYGLSFPLPPARKTMCEVLGFDEAFLFKGVVFPEQATKAAELKAAQEAIAALEGEQVRLTRTKIAEKMGLSPSAISQLQKRNADVKTLLDSKLGARLAATRRVRDIRPKLQKAFMARDIDAVQALVDDAGLSALDYFSFLGALAESMQRDDDFYRVYEAFHARGLRFRKGSRAVTVGRLDATKLFPDPQRTLVPSRRYIFHDHAVKGSDKEREEAFLIARNMLEMSDFMQETLMHQLGSRDKAKVVITDLARDGRGIRKRPLYVRVIRFHRGTAQNVYLVMVPYKRRMLSFTLQVSLPDTSEEIRKKFHRLFNRRIGIARSLIVPVYQLAFLHLRRREHVAYSSRYLDRHPALRFDGRHFYLKALHLKDRSATFLDEDSTRKLALSIALMLTYFYKNKKQISDFDLGRGDLLVNRASVWRSGPAREIGHFPKADLSRLKLVAWRSTKEGVAPADFLRSLFRLDYLGTLVWDPRSAQAIQEGVLLGLRDGLIEQNAQEGRTEQEALQTAREWLLSYVEGVDGGAFPAEALFPSERVRNFVTKDIEPRLGARLAVMTDPMGADDNILNGILFSKFKPHQAQLITRAVYDIVQTLFPERTFTQRNVLRWEIERWMIPSTTFRLALFTRTAAEWKTDIFFFAGLAYVHYALLSAGMLLPAAVLGAVSAMLAKTRFWTRASHLPGAGDREGPAFINSRLDDDLLERTAYLAVFDWLYRHGHLSHNSFLVAEAVRELMALRRRALVAAPGELDVPWPMQQAVHLFRQHRHPQTRAVLFANENGLFDAWSALKYGIIDRFFRQYSNPDVMYGPFFAATAELIAGKTGRVEDAGRYLRALNETADPVEAEEKVLGARLADGTFNKLELERLLLSPNPKRSDGLWTVPMLAAHFGVFTTAIQTKLIGMQPQALSRIVVQPQRPSRSAQEDLKQRAAEAVHEKNPQRKDGLWTTADFARRLAVDYFQANHVIKSLGKPERFLPRRVKETALPADPLFEDKMIALYTTTQGVRPSTEELDGWLEGIRRRLVRRAFWRYPWFDPEDVAHDTLLSAVGSIHQFRGVSLQEFTAWLYKTQKNVYLMTVKSEKPQTTVPWSALGEDLSEIKEPVDPSPSPEALYDESDMLRRLARIIGLLPEQYREVMRLKVIEDRDNDEIAEGLGISESAVKGRVHKGRHQLRTLIHLEDNPLYERLAASLIDRNIGDTAAPAGARLSSFFIQVANAQEADGARLAIEQAGRVHVFRIRENGRRLEAVSADEEVVVRLKVPLDAAGVGLAEDALIRSIEAETRVITAQVPTIYRWDVGIFDGYSDDDFDDAIADVAGTFASSFATDSLLELTGPADRLARALKDPAVLALKTKVVPGLSPEQRLSVEIGQTRLVNLFGVEEGRTPEIEAIGRPLPLRRPAAHDAFGARLAFTMARAVASADLSDPSHVEALARAWKKGSGLVLPAELLRRMLVWGVALGVFVKYALLPLAPLDADLHRQYLQRRTVEVSA